MKEHLIQLRSWNEDENKCESAVITELQMFLDFTEKGSLQIVPHPASNLCVHGQSKIIQMQKPFKFQVALLNSKQYLQLYHSYANQNTCLH